MSVWNGVGYNEAIPQYSEPEGQLCKVIYRCEFRMETAYMHVDGSSIADFKEGFWLNDKYEFTKCSDAVTWMPPSSIIRITKEQKQLH